MLILLYTYLYISLLYSWLLCSLLHACVASWLAVVFSVLGVWCFMAGCRNPAFGCGASWLAVVLPASGVRGFMACCRAPASGWVRSLEASARILQPGTQAGARTKPSVRRRSPLNGSVSGFFLIGYYSICQLFKFSYRLLHAKVFRGENIIKTLFSINYRGYFIIQAAHLTLNYSYFLHKTGRKHVENQ